MTEPFAYVARWTRKRSTARLQAAEATAANAECECDGYGGFECGKHRRLEEIRWALDARASRRPPHAEATS